MLSSIFHVGTFSIESVGLAMVTALILGIGIAFLYKRESSYTVSYTHLTLPTILRV